MEQQPQSPCQTAEATGIHDQKRESAWDYVTNATTNASGFFFLNALPARHYHRSMSPFSQASRRSEECGQVQ